MTWYTTGTIGVTTGSPTVYGTGTLWVDTGTLNAGDIILINSSLYQVQSIQSNTQLTLASNFSGTTASGVFYAIIPIGLLPSALAQQVKTTLASASTALTSAVLNTPGQAMTSTQQLNARQNIGALGAADVGQGYVSLSVAGNTNVALSSTQAQASIINLTGTLTGNINVSTSMTPRLYIVENATTGAFTLTFIGSSGTGAVVPQGGSSLLFCDGTNIYGLISFVGSITELSGGLKTANNTLDDGSGNATIAGTGVFSVGGTQLYKDTNGNLGIQVVPSAWDSGWSVTEFPGGWIGTGSGSSIAVGQNIYSSGSSYLYKSNGGATDYQQFSGSHQWYTAPSGTAGSAISFAQVMTLDNSGNLLVGTTSTSSVTGNCFYAAPSASGARIGIGHYSGAGNDAPYSQFFFNGTAIGSITQSGTTGVAYNTTSDPRLKNITGPLTAAAATAFVNGLKPLVGTWKADGSPFCGFLTTDYAQIDPGAVVGQPDATEDIGDLKDAEGKVLQSGVPQPTTLENGQTWTKTDIQNVYQSMEYASPAWCANMTAALQGALATIAEMQSLLHTAGIKGF